ncbi:hypothetical protein [Plantactinospora sp. B24E8]|uniref:hypothetical protein n=1 Tax=Plantactinospora sp. B24E8 TaxID=3153567 RepID=UPI00325D7D42
MPDADPAGQAGEFTRTSASAYLTVENGRAWLYGPPRRRFERVLADAGRVVGLGPGWVVRRCRLPEAALYATEGGPVDWVGLAADLGYYDRAHLVRDLTAAVGVPPARYTDCSV